jgi:hypothetical protein
MARESGKLRHSTAEIHPKLKPVMRVFSVMRWVLVGCVLGIVAVFAILYVRQPDPSLLVAAGVAAVSLLFVFLVMERVLAATLRPRLERANRLLHSARPHLMTMRPTGVGTARGFLVELAPRDAPDDAPPWGIASITTGGRRKQPKVQDVHVYHDPSDASRSLVVEGDAVYWGTLTTPDDRENDRRTVHRVMVLLFAMLVMLAVVYGVIMDMRLDDVQAYRSLAEESARWPRAQGLVTRSGVEETRITRGRSTVTGYEASVTYMYTVNGDAHAGSVIHFCYEPTRSFRAAHTLAARYPAGTRVPIAYRPGSPGVSVLEAGNAEACRAAEEWIWKEALLVGVMGVLLAAVLAAVFWWQHRRRMQTAGRLARHGIRF